MSSLSHTKAFKVSKNDAVADHRELLKLPALSAARCATANTPSKPITQRLRHMVDDCQLR
jgi:hypothetical protein